MTFPLGYRYSSVYAGIRKVRRDDLALIVSDEPAAAAAIFTTNRVQAAPVRLSRKHLKASKGRVKAILINAGNANCATRTGDKVALSTTTALAKRLKCPVEQVLPSSTGVIGVELNASLITKALPKLVGGLSTDRFDDVSQAILTTDTVRKVAFAEVALQGGVVRIAGMTKGAGMIQPNMATTLGYVLTDAAIPAKLLHGMLTRAADVSYHRLTVDGDTSTNDTLALLANGASGVRVTGKDETIFEEALHILMQDLARQIARDGEGAKKLITIHLTGAADDESAARMGRAIANSPLVKTAIAGSDANWGRILTAAGYSGVAFDPSKVDIYLQGVRVCQGGLAARFNEASLKKKLDQPECEIRFVINGRGKGKATFYTCDLTHGYIDINASYRT
ncbi:MAG: bifunctional glutamate N-acetyltransferase/amino-acid acetyltransferase ArgJ [Bryobacteraceae bacterium]|nr:bifunctional glutamate N-acetyltransferase/amino-acid acetyltransferase ArgJ [Bryobacteraceae bacterium]